MKRFVAKPSSGDSAACQTGQVGSGSVAPRLRQHRPVVIELGGAILGLAVYATGAYGQSTEAARYVNAQGIEVIQARRAVAAGLIPSKEQAARDEDRLAILQEELKDETAALEAKLKILQSPVLKSKLSPDELRRVEETMIRHEKNIHALNAEIGRVRRQS